MATVTTAGEPYSYIAPPQRRLFDLLRQAGRVIPTTARSPEQLARVKLPFNDWAICTNGAVILEPDGAPCLLWRQDIKRRVAALAMRAPEVAERVRAMPSAAELRVDLLAAEGLPILVMVRHPKRGSVATWLREYQPLLPMGWTVDPAKDSALIHPKQIHKAAAVRWFIEHQITQPALLLGAGDRHGDARFMAACDFAILPTASQLFESLP